MLKVNLMRVAIAPVAFALVLCNQRSGFCEEKSPPYL